jgi:hypothetical protein
MRTFLINFIAAAACAAGIVAFILHWGFGALFI